MQIKQKKTCRSAVVIIALFAVMAALLSGYLIDRHSKTHFTVEKWNNYAWNDRQFLVKSFLRQYDLSQLTRSDIVALLGDEPEFYDEWPIPDKTPDNLVYDFGNIKKQYASNIALVIQFGETGRVSSYELKTYSQ